MTDFLFVTPARVLVGWGAATDGRLAAEAAALGTRPLLVCGSSLERSGTLARIVPTLEARGLTVTIAPPVPPEPSLDDCERTRLAAVGCDSVLAIGGGSALDVAKAAALAPFGEPIARYFSGALAVPDSGGLPLLAAPTTAGTGSEATWVGVYTDKAGPRKASIRGGAMLPRTVVLDAQLTVSCPATVTAYSGMDAYVQAVESLTSVGANDLTTPLALRAAQLIEGALETAYREPENRTAREAMLLGSYMAGVALNTSRLGLVHGLAHPIGALTGVAHGLLCGLLMPPVAAFNPAEKYRALVGEADFAAHAARLLAELSIPTRLRDIGLSRADLPRVAAEAMTSGSTKANPRPVSEADALAVLESCY